MVSEEDLLKEVSYKAIRSSGSGGQHVNKVSSKVELSFPLEDSKVLTEEQKEQLRNSLSNRLTKDGILILQCGTSRSQHKNKELVTQRFLEIIEKGLHIKKSRKPTKIPKAVKIKRLKNKRLQADRKANRKKPDIS